MSKGKYDWIYKKIQEQQMALIEEQLEEMEKDPTKRFKWVKEWKGGAPYNYYSKKDYKGSNLFLLDKGGAYMTFLQAKQNGYKVRKGAKSKAIIYWFPTYNKKKKDEKTNENDTETKVEDEITERSYTYLKPVIHNVFHESDIIDFINEDDREKEIILTPIEKEQNMYKMLINYTSSENIKLVIDKSDKAYYSPSQHKIVNPKDSQFDKYINFLSTLLHESVHSTGHSSILNRKTLMSHGNKDIYAEEELVAEIGASIGLAMFGLFEESTNTNQITYIKGWHSRIKEKPEILSKSFQMAQKAIDYIFNYRLDGEVTIVK